MSKKIKNLFKTKKPPIVTGIILGVLVAVFLLGLINNALLGKSAIKVVSAQNVFQSAENPQFVFVYKKESNIFSRLLAAINNLFSSNTIEVIATAKVVNAKGEEVDGLNPQIREESGGKFSVEIDHSRLQQELRPGKYTIEMEIKDGDKTYIQKQEFLWGVLAINVNKSIYLPGEDAYLQFAVLSEKGETICDAKIKLEVRGSGLDVTTLSTEDGTIEYSGKCFGNNVTDIPDYFAHYKVNGPGKYEMKLTNLNNGYSITDYFEVRESVEFDIERTGPTRIWPQADYEMKIKVKANQDFKGEIIETVPFTFVVENIFGENFFRNEPDINTYAKEIGWKVNLKKGETREFIYSFDALDVSPYFYLLGPLKLYASDLEIRDSDLCFVEARKWQVAADAISFINSTKNNADNGADVTLTLSGLGLQEGDLVIVAYSIADNDNVDFNMATYNSPGWTEVADLFSNDTYDANLGVYYKVMSSSPDSSVVLDGLGGADTDTSAVALAFRGVDPSNPLDVTSTTATGLNTMHPNPPSIDHNNPSGVYTVIAGANANGGQGNKTFTFPANYTTNAVQQPANDASDGIVGLGYRTNPADPEDPGVMTGSGTDSTNYAWAAVTMALRPRTYAISGSCKQNDQSTNCGTCTGCVKAAVNGTLDSASGNIAADGTWSITLASTAPTAGNPITVFKDGVVDNSEAVAVTEWVSGYDLTGVLLYENHLNIGHTGGAVTISNSDISTYDNSVSTGDEDVFCEASATSLQACYVSGCESAEIYIVSGNTFQPNSGGSSYVEVHDIEIDGTFDMTGAGNYASISGSWNNDSVFTPNSSIIFFVASDSAEVVSASAGITSSFYRVQFGDSATASYTGQWTLNGAETTFDVNDNLTIDAGTLVNSGTKNVTLAGNLSLATNGNYTKGSGTFTFDGTSKTWADNRAAPADMGAVTIDGGGTITFNSSVKVTSLNITSGDTLAAGGAYTLTLSGTGASVFTNSGTFTCSTGTVAYEGNAATTIGGLNGNSHYYNLTIGLASDNNTILFSAGGEIEASGSITVSGGGTGTHTFDQGSYNLTAEGSPTAITVESGAQWRSVGTGDLVLGGNFSNAGSVSFSANDVECTDEEGSDDISISSTDTNSRTWSGTGIFNLYNITASYQADSSITCYSCTNSGSTSTWTFVNCPSSSVLYQSHFRWRNDDGSETNATWKRPEDQPHSSQKRSENVRLRFVVANTGEAATTAKTYELQVAAQGGYGSCESVPSTSYSVVPTTTAGCGSAVACMTTSTQITNQGATTPQLTAVGTFVAGKTVEDPSNQSDAIVINANYYTEHEYNFQFTSNAVNNTNYCFRVTKAGIPLNAYTNVPQITVESTGAENSLWTRLLGSLRIKGGTRISRTGGIPGSWSCGDTLVDSRDSKEYATVQIGTQCWMAQGLNVGTRIDGTVTQDGWSGTTCGSIDKYCYANTAANCDSNNHPNYPDGGLYQWDQAMCGSTTAGVQGICPTGWHIPTDAELYTLESYLWTTGDCISDRTGWGCEPAGTALKPNGSSGFEGNLAGNRDPDGSFYNRTTIGYFWSSSQYDVSWEWNRSMDRNNVAVHRNNDNKVSGFSVRCLKD